MVSHRHLACLKWIVAIHVVLIEHIASVPYNCESIPDDELAYIGESYKCKPKAIALNAIKAHQTHFKNLITSMGYRETCDEIDKMPTPYQNRILAIYWLKTFAYPNEIDRIVESVSCFERGRHLRDVCTEEFNKMNESYLHYQRLIKSIMENVS